MGGTKRTQSPRSPRSPRSEFSTPEPPYKIARTLSFLRSELNSQATRQTVLYGILKTKSEERTSLDLLVNSHESKPVIERVPESVDEQREILETELESREGLADYLKRKIQHYDTSNPPLKIRLTELESKDDPDYTFVSNVRMFIIFKRALKHSPNNRNYLSMLLKSI